MGISTKHKIIFIHIPKNGGSSVNKHFDSREGGHHKWDWYKKHYPKEWKEYFKFAIIRDPFERVVSNFEYAKMERSYWHSSDGNARFGVHKDYEKLKGKSFGECIRMLPQLEYIGWKPQYIFINNEVNLFRLDQLPELGITEHVNTSPRREKYYTPVLRAIVKKFYAKDIELWKSLS